MVVPTPIPILTRRRSDQAQPHPAVSDVGTSPDAVKIMLFPVSTVPENATGAILTTRDDERIL